MRHSIKDIAEAVGAVALGASDLMVTGVNEPASATPDQLALAMNPKWAADLANGQARVAMLWDGADWQGMGLQAAIIAPRPRFAMAALSAHLDPGQGFDAYGDGVHPSAVVHETAQLGQGVQIGPFTVIGAGVQIGAGSVIGPQCHIGQDSVIGNNAFLREAVRIGARVTIGADFICHPGVVIGSDGFSFVTPEVSAVEKARKSLGDQGEVQNQAYVRIHSLGAVTIGNNVEIGANSCIDNGSVRDTRIGDDVKIDNLVHIGHNVEVGDGTLLCGQVGIAGSTRIGRNVVLAGQVGVNDNITIGDNVICGGGTKVFTKIPAGRVMLGYPALKMETHIEAQKGIRRLPRLFRDVADLKKAVFNSGSTD